MKPKTNTAISKFRKGTATYVCTMCGKLTRAVSVMTMYEAVELCAACYNLLEAENQASDTAE